MMSYIKARINPNKEPPDMFEELYQRSPVPKNLFLNSSGISVNTSTQGGSLHVQKSHIFNQLKSQNSFKSPPAIYTSKSFHEQSLQKPNYPTNLELPRQSNAVQLPNTETCTIKRNGSKDNFDGDISNNSRTSWQNNTFRSDIQDNNKLNRLDEVDGVGHKSSASFSYNNSVESSESHSEVLTDRSVRSSAGASMSAAAIFKKIKLLSPSKELESISIENQENQDPESSSNVSTNDYRYPIEVNVQTRKEVTHVGAMNPQDEFIQEALIERVTNPNNVMQDHGLQICKDDEEPDTSVYKLYSWIIKPIPEVKGICVEGKKSPNDEQFFQSSIVTTRIKKNVVSTLNGSQYRLVGNMEKLDALDAEERLEAKAVNDIAVEDKIPDEINHLQESPDRISSENVLTDWIIRPIGTSDICVDGKKSGTEEYWHSTAIDYIIDKRTLVTTSGTVYKIQGQISQLDMLESGFSKRVIKKFINGFPKSWKIYVKEHLNGLSRRRTERYLTPKAQKPGTSDVLSEVYTPTGKVELGSLKTTRSGRVVKPTLAWWAGQRVKTYDDNTFETTYISSHTPEILKEMSETYKARHLSTSTNKRAKIYSSDSSAAEKSKSTDKNALVKINKSGKRVLDGQPKQKRLSENEKNGSYSYDNKNVRSHDPSDCRTTRYSRTTTSLNSADEDLDSLVEDLDNTVTQAKLKRKTPVVRKDTCYSQTGKSKKTSNKKSDDTYSVDLDQDFEEDSNVKGQKSKKGRKRTVSSKSSAVQNKNGNKGPNSKKLEDQSKNKLSDNSSSRKLRTNDHRKKNCISSDEESNDDDGDLSKKTGTVKSSEDSDPDLEKDTNVKGQKSNLKSKKGRKSTDSSKSVAVQNKNGSKGTNSIKHGEQSKNKRSDTPKMSENSKKKDITSRSLRKRTDDYNERMKICISSEEESGDDNDFSKKTGTVKAKRTQSRINKPTEKPKDEQVSKKKTGTSKAKDKQNGAKNISQKVIEELLPWSKQEISTLNNAIASIPGDNPSFWEIVAEKVGTRTSEECIAWYYKDVPKSTKKRKVNNTVKPNEVRTITAGKGTLKRKQQLRDLIEHHNDGYEDDLFDSTPYRNQGNVKVPKLMDESDGDIFEEMSRKHPHLLNKIYTPLTRVHLDPVSEKKTPATSLESPWTNIDRKDADHYIHQLQKRRQMKGRKILEKNQTPVNKKSQKTTASPTKNLFGKSFDSQSLFMDDASSSENHDNSDEEADYYFSDMEN
ncbi:mis18-binding protein 1-like isoform X6 [Mytilus edulis]|uniref:mis18-binding protein 1-like isoform X6 n=1 Tax=Mytilus edulis TaxID=6550 RepID=UPI0039EE4A3B